MTSESGVSEVGVFRALQPNGPVQRHSISIANALEIQQSHIKLSRYITLHIALICHTYCHFNPTPMANCPAEPDLCDRTKILEVENCPIIKAPHTI